MITNLLVASMFLLFFRISIETIKVRKKYQVSLGHGDNKYVAKAVSAHSNFVSYVPFMLIMFYLVEVSGEFPKVLLGGVALAFFVGRLLHFIAFRNKMNFKLRTLGMHLTVWPMVFLAACHLYLFFNSLV